MDDNPITNTTGFSYHLIRVEDDGRIVGIELDDQQVTFETYFEANLGTAGVTLGRLKIGSQNRIVWSTGRTGQRMVESAVIGQPKTTKWLLTVFAPDDQIAIQLPLTDEQAASIMPVAQEEIIGDWPYRPIGEAYLERVQDDKPSTQTTIEQRAWQIVHEFGPRWQNEYFRRYPDSKATEKMKREEMIHYCVVAALGGDPHIQ